MEQLIKAIIIDDEPLARKKVEAFVMKTGLIELCGSFQNPVEALSFINDNNVDLIFLDIRMSELSGFDFMDRLNIRPRIIITSAYEEYALKGFEYEVDDYLLKPFSYERFLKAVEKIKTTMDTRGQTQQPEINYITVKSEHKVEKINIDSILYIEGMRDYLRIHTMEKKIMTLMSFSAIEEILPSEMFIRIHKSFMVAIEKITVIGKDSVSVNNNILPIGRSYKKQFFERVIK